MDSRLLEHYNRELRYIREVGGEFSKQYPKIASRLGLDSIECADPYVERLLEGFAFLAARIQLKLDARFPDFTQHLLELVYPHYLAPTPAMTVVEFEPDFTDTALADGVEIPADTVLHADFELADGDKKRVEFRTAMRISLSPLEIMEAEYISGVSRLPDIRVRHGAKVRAGIRLRLATPLDAGLEAVAHDSIHCFLRGSDALPGLVLESLLTRCAGVVAQAPDADWSERLPDDCLSSCGFEEDEALLPRTMRSFSGYRLLHEYFAFSERFRFFRLRGLRKVFARSSGQSLDLFILLEEARPDLERNVDAEMFRLHCTPAINLFPKRLDRIHLNEHSNEYHLVPDRGRPQDFEIAQVTQVIGYGADQSDKQEFLPFYSAVDPELHRAGQAYYTVRRESRLLSSREKERGTRSAYVGGEVYLSLVDPDEAPYSSKLRQLSVRALCTNRDLPLLMAMRRGACRFSTELSAPVNAIQTVAGPSHPYASHAEGETGWRLVSHLSLNYLSLVDGDKGQGAHALRELLDLYAFREEPELRRQIEGLVNVESRPIHRRLPGAGAISFARGLEVTLTFDESAFEGVGCFLLGMVLEHFLAKYVSLNSFTETVLKSTTRGEIARWPARIGQRQIL